MIFEKLAAVQKELKAPKGQYNSFGKYKYRSCEDILEAVKPIAAKHKMFVTVGDELVHEGDRFYIKATAKAVDAENGETYSETAYAREEETKKGMDASQITGTASSYARKYALNGLLCIDDTKDADTDENQNQREGRSKAEKKEDKTAKEAKEDVENMKIADIKVKSLQEKCKNDGVPEEKVLKAYKLKSFSEMTEKQFSNCINNWEKVKTL